MICLLLLSAFVSSSTAGYPSSGYLLGRDISWTETFVVEGGRSEVVTGRLYSENISISGNFTVRSCCGLSPNDIVFSIEGRDFGGLSYGTVVNGTSFGWNTGTNEKFRLIYDNTWPACSQGLCRPNASDPRSHNKTVELSAREIAPAELRNLALSWLFPLAVIIGALTAGTLLIGIGILVRRRRRGLAVASARTVLNGE